MVSVARNTSDKIFLLNFETPNWFNSTSPKKKDKKLWVGWDYISKRCDVILSISKESQKWAKEYFYDLNSNLEYKYFYTNINSYIADLAPSYVSKKNTIICISRFDPHKGLDGLTELINENLSGCDLIIVLGSGSLSEEILNQFKKKSRYFNVRIIIKQSISEIEKFRLIKKSSVMIFPSFFEGFGMPPLEALYCNVPVVAFELPVLKEYAKENINFVKIGDYRALSVLCKNILLDKSKYKIDNNYINNIAKMGDLNNQLKSIFI